MSLSHFESLGLLPFCRQMELQFVNFYYGTNPGCWKSCLPHDRLLFILKSDGKSSFDDGSRVQVAKYGDWILIPAFHPMYHNHNETMLHLSIHFSLSVCGGFDPLSEENTFFSNHDPTIIDTVASGIGNTDRLSLATNMQFWCWAILRLVLPKITSTTISTLYANPEYAKLFDFFWKNTSARTRVEDMAEFAKMGKESFAKKFVRDVKISPARFLDRILAAHAVRMLQDKQRLVKEISADLNFCSEFYFSRFFRRQMGMSPRGFRNRFTDDRAEGPKPGGEKFDLKCTRRH